MLFEGDRLVDVRGDYLPAWARNGESVEDATEGENDDRTADEALR